MRSAGLALALRAVLREFAQRARGLPRPPVIYVVGAGSLVLDGIIDRATQDLDFVCDDRAAMFVNVVVAGGNHSHSVPPGLVSMPRGWRERAKPLRGFRSTRLRVLVPELADRLMDKLARGSATDWQDIEAAVRSTSCPSPRTLRVRAVSVLSDPPSSVFDPVTFREHYERLARLLSSTGRRLSPLGDEP